MEPKFDIPKQARNAAIASIQRYFEANLDQSIGELPAGLLLNYFIEEVGPVLYNRAITDAQTRMAQRVDDLTGELFEDELQYWPRQDAKKRRS